jgi:hypothetical protein
MVEDQEPHHEGNAVHDQVGAVDDQVLVELMQALRDGPGLREVGPRIHRPSSNDLGQGPAPSAASVDLWAVRVSLQHG